MSIFTIDAENNITAHASSQEATLVEGTGVIQFHCVLPASLCKGT